MYTSLNAIMIKLHYKPFSLQKDETHGQYTMRPSDKGSQSSFSITYIFSKYFSLQYSCIFSL